MYETRGKEHLLAHRRSHVWVGFRVGTRAWATPIIGLFYKRANDIPCQKLTTFIRDNDKALTPHRANVGQPSVYMTVQLVDTHFLRTDAVCPTTTLSQRDACCHDGEKLRLTGLRNHDCPGARVEAGRSTVGVE